jgi:hypothetical protein
VRWWRVHSGDAVGEVLSQIDVFDVFYEGGVIQ